MKQPRAGVLWRRWVIANSWGELLGLGATLAIGATIFSGVAEAEGVGAAVLAAVLMTATGALEGAIVGFAQWSVLRTALGSVTRRSWIMATVIGGVLAWLLGSIPMTVASLSSVPSAGTAEEPPQPVVLALAVLLGLFAGLILSIAQWRVLRGYVHKAWRWLPANALAWAAGMPLIFAGIDVAQQMVRPVAAMVTMGLIIAVAGAIVGAIHGIALVAFVPRGST